ncbi:terminase small subunit [Fructilactobacillus frigidiflavus]|uniref:terminase small subunit n=1 Tax=Fructilactobacillus frigidiflavus TaxID=3242688 RepID=UPI0037562E17
MDKYEKAKQEYMAGKSYEEIGRMFGVTASTVRSWKARKHWGNSKSTARVRKTRQLLDHDIKHNQTMTEKQKLFCMYYIQSFNATQSYIKVYHCKYGTARVESHRMLNMPKIKAVVSKHKARYFNDLILDTLDLIREDLKIAFSDIGDVVDWEAHQVPLVDENGEVKTDTNGNVIYDRVTDIHLKDSGSVDTSTLDKVISSDDTIKVKLKSSDRAKERLYKYLTALNDDSETSAIDRMLDAITQGSEDNDRKE